MMKRTTITSAIVLLALSLTQCSPAPSEPAPSGPTSAPKAAAAPVPLPPAQMELEKGAHVVLLGNTLAERMQHDGWLESYVQSAWPDREIVFRNHGFSGDMVAHRPRNNGFIDPHTYLEISKADVIFALFGYNESYDNNPDSYRQQLGAWVDDTLTRKYNGEGPPKIVLFSPIAHESLGSPNLPDGSANNLCLAAYAEATAAVAQDKGLPYVDLFNGSLELYEKNSAPLTINGIHLNSEGNDQIAQHVMRTLFGLRPSAERVKVERIRQAVLDKNWHWFNRYRATDGNDVWGGRAGLKFVDNQSNRDVLWHELTMIDVMTANRDKRVWAVANGDDSYKVDDSNVPPPVTVISNVGGKSKSSDKNKEGQLSFMTPEETTAQLELAEGFEVNLFASEAMFPELVNPVQMSVDTKGRLWVAAWSTYPKWEPLKEMTDRLLILPDENRDGVADKAITFAKIHNPTGFEFWGGGVIVASAPDLVFLKDTDGDDVADVRVRIMHGLDSADTHHGANNLVYGPDGNIYYQRGVFHVSNVETPWMKAQEHRNSAMYRFNPRTFEFAFHANNSPNPHGICFDYWGYHFASDGTGGQCYQVRPHGEGAFKMQKLLDKTVRPVAANGILSSAHLPDENQGNFLVLNTIGFLGIKQYTLETKENGDVWGTPTADLIRSRGDRNFRPTDVEVGDDGALYVSDWQNVIIGHMQHNVRDPNRDKEHGRVYRITATGRPLMEHVNVDGQPIADLLDLLTVPTNIVRHRVHVELSERDTDDVIAAVSSWVKQWDANDPNHAHHLLEALWVHQQHNVQNHELLATVLASPVGHARTAAKTVEHFWARDPRKIAPGGNQPEAKVRPRLTAEAELKRRGFKKPELDLYRLGAEVYVRDTLCVTCHQLDGKGLPEQYPAITPNAWTGGDPERLIKITLHGLWGDMELDGKWFRTETDRLPPMTPFKDVLSDREVAGVLTYTRNTFGNSAKPVSPATVAAVRKSLGDRDDVYLFEEIMKEHPFKSDELEKNRNPK